MATSGDGRTPYKISGSKKRIRLAEIEEEIQNIFHDAAANIGISELEQMMKQMTFTRSDTQHLISLLNSRTIDESPPKNENFLSSISTQDSKLIKYDASGFEKTLMASPQTPATIENLPDVILSNIFIRLFAKQLAQMRSVQKSWNALLSESSFIKFHLNHSISIHKNHPTLLHFNSDEFRPVDPILVNPNLQIPNSIKFPGNPEYPENRLRNLKVIGSVNGLICSSYTDTLIHIWNPSLSTMLTLPQYSMPATSKKSEDDDGWLKICFRFGYDPKTDDYKLVKLTAFANLDSSEVLWWMDVEIYSMRNGCWKLITERVPSHITWIDEHEVVCVDGPQGHIHWIGCIDEELYSKTIVAFDLGSETFREIPLPHSTLDYKYGSMISLGVLAGKLCVMEWGEIDKDVCEVCEVWVMEEYGVAESWVKRHVFSQFNGDLYPFGFTSGNKFLFQDQDSCLVMFDPDTEEAQILKNDCSYEEYDAGKIMEYVDSLVWVAPKKIERVDGVPKN